LKNFSLWEGLSLPIEDEINDQDNIVGNEEEGHVQDKLLCHGQQWRNEGEVTVDESITANRRSYIKWHRPDFNRDDIKSPLTYFTCMFPMTKVDEIVRLTNAKLMDAGTLTVKEFWQYLGIRLTMTIDRSHLSLDDYWKVQMDVSRTVIEPKRYGDKYKMSRTRFKPTTNMTIIVIPTTFRQIISTFNLINLISSNNIFLIHKYLKLLSFCEMPARFKNQDARGHLNHGLIEINL
jgi:hypothetical protein